YEFLQKELDLAKMSKITKSDLRTKPQILASLNKAIMQDYFGMDIIQPKNTLLPTLGLRINHILYLKDYLNSIEPSKIDKKIIGCDIGCGASCIYPLLGLKLIDRISNFYGTDCNEINYRSALQNVYLNSLEAAIE
ncbi:MAG: hypothetical protein MHPSP_003680, partial [Paramarteilia canceri]